MRTMAVSEFKSGCLALLKQVERTGEPLVVTLRGRPLAQVGPPRGAEPARPRLGALRGRLHVRGDIVHHDWSAEWEGPARGPAA